MRNDDSTHWVFLRGLVRESAHWDDFPQRFASAIPGVRIHLVDLPGNGEHWHLSSPLSLPRMAEFARSEVVSRIGASANKRIYLLSVSLGSMVALDWLHRWPGEISGAVLINTSLRGMSPWWQRLSWRIWPLMVRILVCRDTAERERLILDLTSRKDEHPSALIKARVAIHERHPVRFANVIRQLLAAARYRPSRDRPDTPLLLLNSLGDRMVSPACTEAIAQRWRLKAISHPWAGHDLPLDDPEWTIQSVFHWLEIDATR